ncbi:hypothetical protein D4T97_014175 [Siminovitchia acidinfaciens]|uniref:Uncharacterized protein n=1 Tax=Siminovitchia acidinfaciens TaxID=2321395 RepID=A0A429XXA3_9BACI|nr:hypothetical protein [Siminovitchia acidinfaciens]RST73138.1 hypothetical protein D4T97_014175 [Siminovitchia acidinfaciens]VEF48121.1 Uncharacterised protein [Bacillus freudenreichii]
MEWTLGGLFAASALLLIISGVKGRKASKEEQKEIDMIHISTMNEIKDIRESIRNLELDMDIVIKESGLQLSSQERTFMREVLDLYNRKYSIENIAAQKHVSEDEIRQIIAPYIAGKNERRKVAHEI